MVGFKKYPYTYIFCYVFIVMFFFSFLIDGFLLHPISIRNKNNAESETRILIQTQYPDATLIQDCSTIQNMQVYYVVTGEDHRLLLFDQILTTQRWRLLDDVVIPDEFTGTITIGNTLKHGKVDFVNGVPEPYRGMFHPASVTLGNYLLISTVTSTIALVPVWIIMLKRKKD